MVTSRGFSPVAVHGLFIVMASLVVEHRLYRVRASVVVAHELSSCGSWAELLYCMWDLPGAEIEPMPPALIDGFFTAEPTGKP